MRESFFIFRRDRGFVVDGPNWKGDVSDVGDEAAEVEAELSPRERCICGFSAGVSIRRAVGGLLLRGPWVVDRIMFRRRRLRI